MSDTCNYIQLSVVAKVSLGFSALAVASAVLRRLQSDGKESAGWHDRGRGLNNLEIVAEIHQVWLDIREGVGKIFRDECLIRIGLIFCA